MSSNTTGLSRHSRPPWGRGCQCRSGGIECERHCSSGAQAVVSKTGTGESVWSTSSSISVQPKRTHSAPASTSVWMIRQYACARPALARRPQPAA